MIGGGGSGIPAYRALQRAGIPFAAGILPESDLDFPVAKALAAELYAVPAFSISTDAGTENVIGRMLAIGSAVSTVPAFGETNAANLKLYEAARSAGILTELDTLIGRTDA